MTRILLSVTAIYVLLGAAVMTFWPGEAWPHSWYDGDCCSSQDCAPVALNAAALARIVDVGPAGIVVRLEPGDHSVVPHAFGERFFPWDDPDLRQSQDDNWHACISMYPRPHLDGAHQIYCVYMPPVGF